MHAAVGDFILDCLQNSVEAGADRIDLEIIQDEDRLSVKLRDNGCGMDQEELKKALDPFYTDGKKHRHRKVGLGLPFLAQAVDLAEGTFRLSSEKGEGTTLEFGFSLNHLDAPPLGRLEKTFLSGFLFSGDHELVVHRNLRGKKGTAGYTVSRRELIDALGGLEGSDSLLLARDFLRNQEEELVNTTF
jgi:hypothetical protein